MDMNIIDIVYTGLGIAVSVVLFIISLRKAVGAGKERVRSGNDEIEKILVRRIVLEGFEPSAEEIMRLIDTKSRDFRIRATDLLSESQFMNNVYTRIVESDFIPHEQRQELLKRLSRTIEEIETSLVQEQSVEGDCLASQLAIHNVIYDLRYGGSPLPSLVHFLRFYQISKEIL